MADTQEYTLVAFHDRFSDALIARDREVRTQPAEIKDRDGDGRWKPPLRLHRAAHDSAEPYLQEVRPGVVEPAAQADRRAVEYAMPSRDMVVGSTSSRATCWGRTSASPTMARWWFYGL
jgi:DICT domain-containing protein